MADGWGGRRENQTGRPKKAMTRKQRQLRAYDDEWDVINRFAKIVKHGDRESCEKFLAKMESKTK